jgi:hypothetical protein
MAVAATGQVRPEPIKPEPTPSALTDPLMTTSLLPLLGRPSIVVGQTSAEVAELLGKPDTVTSFKKKGKFIWYYHLLAVTFRSGKVTKVQTFSEQSNDLSTPTSETPSTPSRAERAAGVAVDIAARFALANVCPNVYRKPLLFMNANDLQWLQACNANGFMFFGVYVYTGRQQ